MAEVITDFSIFTNGYVTDVNPLQATNFGEFIHLASYNISAFGSNGTNYNLTLGGSSNIRMEGSNMAQIFTSSNGVQYYTTVSDGDVRTDDLYLSLTNSNATTYLTSPYSLSIVSSNSLSIDSITFDTSAPAVDTISTSKATLQFDNTVNITGALDVDTLSFNVTSPSKDVISTSKALLEFDNDVKVTGSFTVDASMKANGTVTVSGNLMADSNFRCSKAIFGSNLNVFRLRNSNGVDTVGYGFQVNTSNQLELIKTTVFLDSNVVSKKVAVFGWKDIVSTDTDDAGYLVFDELKGLGVAGAGGGETVFTSGGYLSLDGGRMRGDIDMFNDVTAQFYSLSNVLHLTASNITASNVSAVRYETIGADYAEYMTKSNPEESFFRGEVVGVDHEGKITKNFDGSLRFMIVSDTAGIIGGNEWVDMLPSPDDVEEYARFLELEQSRETIAFCGRVPTEVPTNEFSPGDFLVPKRSIDGTIELVAAKPSDLSLMEYVQSVGQVIATTTQGNPLVIVRT